MGSYKWMFVAVGILAGSRISQADILLEDNFSTLDTAKWKTVLSSVSANTATVNSDKLRIELASGYAKYQLQGVVSQNKYSVAAGQTLVIDCLIPNSDSWLSTSTSQLTTPTLLVSANDIGSATGINRPYFNHYVALAGGSLYLNEFIYSRAGTDASYASYNVGGKTTYGATKHFIITINATTVNFYIQDTAYAAGMTPIYSLAAGGAFTAEQLQNGLYIYLLSEANADASSSIRWEQFESITVTSIPVPEPSALSLLGAGAVSMIMAKRNR